ncbi:hypothetical protein IAI10_08345 [Clostridium sp. 19966]|uniref:hypothetical protein n=1 Tax=Clostridium sp. 19966 TaxID=2768166 RepID=UPI0028DE5054|nr:hypothetical protein [Clostridium sp. 19966]MDT8716665.1 hypothetical protein [Clostridium sp. 19966]
MDYLKSAMDLEKKLLELLQEEKFKEFNALLQKREDFYRDYAENNPDEMRKVLNSLEFKSMSEAINKEGLQQKEKIKQEIKDLNLSQKAALSYRQNSPRINSFFSTKI